MSFLEFDEQKLIKIVAKHPIIYDINHNNYRNKVAKENVWNTIAKELNASNNECKKKWKFIRDGYNRFTKKHKLNTNVPKHSKNKRHRQLSFLDGVPKRNHLWISRGSNGPTSSQELSDKEENPEIDQSAFEEKVFIRESSDVAGSDGDEMESTDASDTDTSDDSKKHALLQKEKRMKNIKLRKGRNKERQNIIKSKKKNDDVEYFCRHIAEVLRKLPPVQKAEAKKHLNTVLLDYEILAAKNELATQNTSFAVKNESPSSG